MIIRKSAKEIEAMARAGRVVAETLALLGESMRSGVTTQELDEIAEEYIRSQGGAPTFKGYHGFPASICTSPNSMVVHGIPGGYRIDEGDLISVDVGVTLEGFVADSAYTFAVGEIDEETQRLLEVGQTALEAGIAEARAGKHIGDISAAVQKTTEEAGFSVVKSLVGHGIGRMSWSQTTAGRSRPKTALSRPISSTRLRSRTPRRASSRSRESPFRAFCYDRTSRPSRALPWLAASSYESQSVRETHV